MSVRVESVRVVGVYIAALSGESGESGELRQHR